MLSHLTAPAALFLLFIFYSVLGWCGEMVYCSIGQRRLCEKRGFLNGTLCPIYGHGALLVLWVLQGGCKNPLLTFFFGMLLTTAVEYVTSYAMEKLFHMRWWDYSRYRFQINGRVCLLNSTLFGLACVLLCHVVHPRVMKLLYFFIDRHAAVPLAAVLLVIYLTDIVFSVRSAIQMGNRLERIHALQEELQSKLEELKEEQVQAMSQRMLRLESAMESKRSEWEERKRDSEQKLRSKLNSLAEWSGDYLQRLEQAKEDVQKRMKPLLEGQDFLERRLLRSHPTLRSERNSEALQRLREYLAHLKK